MDVLSETLDRDAAYKLMMGVIVPRPIAWVTSLAPDGIVNAAPFSCFCSVSTDPPMIGINIGDRAGELKDTARNMVRTGEFVVNIADTPLTEALHASSHPFPPSISELETIGLASSASVTIATPRIAAAPLQMECVLHQVIPFGKHARFYVGLIKLFRIRDDLYRNGRITTSELDPVARVAGPVYARLGDYTVLSSARPE
jgi:flavin reductase (DIM6/NTAB) family NADH-FMN oxidoreductase RutF